MCVSMVQRGGSAVRGGECERPAECAHSHSQTHTHTHTHTHTRPETADTCTPSLLCTQARSTHAHTHTHTHRRTIRTYLGLAGEVEVGEVGGRVGEVLLDPGGVGRGANGDDRVHTGLQHNVTRLVRAVLLNLCF